MNRGSEDIHCLGVEHPPVWSMENVYFIFSVACRFVISLLPVLAALTAAAGLFFSVDVIMPERGYSWGQQIFVALVFYVYSFACAALLAFVLRRGKLAFTAQKQKIQNQSEAFSINTSVQSTADHDLEKRNNNSSINTTRETQILTGITQFYATVAIVLVVAALIGLFFMTKVAQAAISHPSSPGMCYALLAFDFAIIMTYQLLFIVVRCLFYIKQTSLLEILAEFADPTTQDSTMFSA